MARIAPLTRTSNPAWTRLAKAEAARGEAAFTIAGATGKTLLLLAVLSLSAAYTWHMVDTVGLARTQPIALGAMLVAVVVALIAIFRPQTAPWTAPLYAVLEGTAIGFVSALYSSSGFTFKGVHGYPGIVPQAAGLTLAAVAAMLALYRTGIIRPTERFRGAVIGATGAIAVYYLISIGASFFGFAMPLIHDNGWAGIGFSLVVIAIAAANLILDFAQFEQAAQQRVQARYEWFAAFGIMLTIVWLYLEMLRLLAKLRRR